MNILEYFDKCKGQSKYDRPLNCDIAYKKTIGDFYNDFIKPHLEKIFKEKKYNLIKWCNVLEEYSNKDLPIYWIRKFERGSGNDVNDNRRGGTTFLVDDNNKLVAAYVYISNFDAQELYNMILNVDDIDESNNDFLTLMLNGEYKFHYDNGVNSVESQIKSYDCLIHAANRGVFNRANLYLAHITDVNGKYVSSIDYVFERGTVNEWEEISKYSGYYNFGDVFKNDQTKKVRVLHCNKDIGELKKYFKAHFFRFIHPFNYYLVPGTSCEINAIIGKEKNKSIGEYVTLTDYVRYRMYCDFIVNDKDLSSLYTNFEKNIQIEDKDKISKSYLNKKSVYDKYSKEEIHIVFGKKIGDEWKKIDLLGKYIDNIDELREIYNNYDKSNNHLVFYKEDKNVKEVVKKYSPDKPPSSTYLDFLDKILRIGEIKTEDTKKIKVKLGDNKKNLISSSRSSIKKSKVVVPSGVGPFNSLSDTYKTSIRTLMRDMKMSCLGELDNRIDEAIGYCQKRKEELKSAGDKKHKDYSNRLSALKKYKEFKKAKEAL